MAIWAVASAVGCKKCPIFRVYPVKRFIGDPKKPLAMKRNPRRIRGRQEKEALVQRLKISKPLQCYKTFSYHLS